MAQTMPSLTMNPFKSKMLLIYSNSKYPATILQAQRAMDWALITINRGPPLTVTTIFQVGTVRLIFKRLGGSTAVMIQTHLASTERMARLRLIHGSRLKEVQRRSMPFLSKLEPRDVIQAMGNPVSNVKLITISALIPSQEDWTAALLQSTLAKRLRLLESGILWLVGQHFESGVRPISKEEAGHLFSDAKMDRLISPRLTGNSSHSMEQVTLPVSSSPASI